MARIASLTLGVLTACAPDSSDRSPEHEALEKRVAEIEALETPAAEIAALEKRVAEIEAREKRLANIEARLASLEAPASPPRPTSDLPAVAQEAGTTEFTRVLDEKQTVSCAFTNLQGIATAEFAYNAAFDKWAPFEAVGWRPDPTHGCNRYLAFRVEPEESDFRAIAVITRGSGRGRRFEMRRDLQVVETARMKEAEILEFTAGRGWLGTAR